MKIFGRKKTKEKAIDDILPSKIKIGNILSTDLFKYILDEDYVFNFDVDGFTVDSMSKYRIHGTDFVNLYLKSTNEAVQFLMIELKDDETIEKIVFFYEYDSVEPQDIDEIDEWLNESNGYIGAEEFIISEDEKDKTFINYYDRGRVEFDEIIYDKNGDEKDRYNNLLSLYSRNIEHNQEYIYLSKIETHEELFISISVGIEISLNDLK